MRISVRITYAIITTTTIISGLASRGYGMYLPDVVADYAGDVLWTSMVYFAMRFLFPASEKGLTVAIALLFSYMIEISQLYQAG